MIFLTLSTLLNCWKSREIESTMYLKILPWKHHCVIVTGKAPRIAVNPAWDVIKNGRGLNFRCRYWRIFVVFREGRFWRCLKNIQFKIVYLRKLKLLFLKDWKLLIRDNDCFRLLYFLQGTTSWRLFWWFFISLHFERYCILRLLCFSSISALCNNSGLLGLKAKYSLKHSKAHYMYILISMVFRFLS